MINFSLAFFLMLIGAATLIDIYAHRIPNILVVIVILLGFAAQGINEGVLGIFAALSGVIIGVLFLLPFHISGSMSAGDVKLMGAVGALLGPLQTLQAALATLIFGGVLALLVVLFSRQSQLFFVRYGLMAKTLIRTGHFVYLPRTADDPASQRFAYAAAISLGTVFVLYQNHAFDVLVLS